MFYDAFPLIPLAPIRRTRRLGPVLIACAAMLILGVYAAIGQNPVALPYTMTTLAGTSPMAATAGTQCPNLPTGVKSTDSYGDGCLAANAIFGAAGRGGVAVDQFGTVFISDDITGDVRAIDPTSGIITSIAGKGTACSGKLDAAGDGCNAATATVTSGQRGIGLDYYGNVLLGGYSDNLVHIICRAASPACSSAQIGTMQLVAGCSQGTGSNGTGGLGSNNVPAFKTSATTCTAALGEVGAPRGANGDKYGNILIGDTNNSRYRVVLGPQTSSFFSGTNPMWAALSVNYASLTAGYAYSIINVTPNCATGVYTSTCGGTPTVKGANCATGAGTTAPVALDTIGDGCPFQYSSVYPSSGYTQAIVPDAAGNVLFTDPTQGLRVLFVSGSGSAGALMTNAIQLTNPGVTPTPGYVYMLAGNVHGTATGTTISTTPALGSAVIPPDSSITKIAIGPQGLVFLGDSTQVLMFDLNTGYIRILFAQGTNVASGSYCNGSSGQKSLTAYSDGCAATQATFKNSNGLGLSTDMQGNLYLYDATSNASGMVVRKVLAQDLAPTTVGTTLIQNYRIHFPESTVGTVGTPTASTSSDPDVSVGTITCGTQNGDNSVDCNVPVTVTPSAPGNRSASLVSSVSVAGSTTGTTDVIALGGVATGSALAIDSATSNGTTISPTTAPIFSGIKPEAVALDGAGNVYALDATGAQILEYIQGTGSASLASSSLTSPAQIAVDQAGDVFAVGSGATAITELAVSGPPAVVGAPATFTPATVSYSPVSGTPTPQAVALDLAGNLFVADKQGSTANTAVYRLTLNSNSATNQATIATGFTNPVSLAVDNSGNVYVADKGVPAVYKLTPTLSSATSNIPAYLQTTVAGLTGVTPAAVSTDAAGNLYVQDAASGSVFEVPLTGPVTTVLTGLTTPAGVAVDGKGTVYSADSAGTTVTQVQRNAVTFNFGTGSTGSPTFAATLTDVGNQTATGSNTVTNTTNFAVAGGTSNGCSFSSSILSGQVTGNACTLTANFIGNGSSAVTDLLTYLPSASTTGSLTLTGTLSGTAVATTTTISTPTPASPNYSGSTEATFTVTVAAQSGSSAPGGTVQVTVDSTITNPSLVASGTNGVATVTVSGLTAGTHTISAIYNTSGSFTGSNSGAAQSFSIAQDATATTWSPATLTLQYSAPIGTSILNAEATSGGSTIPGTFVYTANGTEVNSASYLARGNYTLGVTFYPTDSVDYATSTASGGTLTVTQASTTAAIGTTQNLVAADGTGNYTSIQTALNALPTTGGSIYIKPGTYSGFVTVVKPNVSMYGLGGLPGNVILTNEDGAFSSPFLPGQGVGNNGSSGDQGSSTMVVARGAIASANGGATFTPYNFYGENFTIQNTYDTDTTTTSTNALVGGVCTANQPATPLATLYNSGTECNSQALAIWITGDQAVLNNIYTTSQQDTIYAGSISSGSGYAARQYWFRGKVTGDVDYIFGDAAAVFDHTSIYTTWHGNTATGTETIEAQNKAAQTGSSGDYLSGYIMNSDVFTSQSTGMTSLYFGRPYGHYSTWVMLNSYVDQVAPVGYIEFSGDTNLPTSTYAEYNNSLYTDPTTGSPDANGVTYLGTGGNSGSGVTGTRETTSQDPGTTEAANTIKTALTQVEAQQYYPINFLGTTVPSNPYNNGVTNWNPTTAIATGVNAFVPTGSSMTVAASSPVTILMRPQVPGLGAVTNGTYTIPTGTYTLKDGATTIASGTLDPSGSAYLVTSTLAAGTHSLVFTYGGDSNFTGSTSSAFTLTVSGMDTVTMLTVNTPTPTYGSSVAVSTTVSETSGSAIPTGNVLLSVDGGTAQSAALNGSGVASFTLTGLNAGNHTLTAIYQGDSTNTSSTGTSSVSLAQLPLTVTANSFSRQFETSNPALGYNITGFTGTDTASNSVTGTAAVSTTAMRNSPVGTYPISVVQGSLASTNYSFSTFTAGVATVTASSGGASQIILFPKIPTIPNGSVIPLFARATSGLPVTYSVSGPATINGHTLTVTGTGTITVTASQSGNSTFAAATSVNRSFTAQ